MDGAKAVDGLANTRWSSASADPQWIEVDLGARHNITGVKLNWETAFGKAYRVETSNGGGDAWRGLFSTTTGDGGIDDLAVSGGGRFVRVTGTARGTEIPETIDVEFSRGKPVLTSSDENTGLAGPNAVDGNPGTRWGSAFADPQSIRVDLGTTQTINRVQLNWEGAYGKAYQVQTSADGLTGWTTIFSTTTGDGGIDNLTCLTGSGRYVRVNGTVRGTGWGYSLWELAVFGPLPRP